MDISMIKQLFENIPGVNKDAFKVAWSKRVGLYSSILDYNNVVSVMKIFDENSINYINPTTGIPEFTLFAFQPKELTLQRLESLQLLTNINKEQSMGR